MYDMLRLYELSMRKKLEENWRQVTSAGVARQHQVEVLHTNITSIYEFIARHWAILSI